ncbi:MAG: hypothetical protein ACLTMP_10045 [Eggerthella lenta]
MALFARNYPTDTRAESIMLAIKSGVVNSSGNHASAGQNRPLEAFQPVLHDQSVAGHLDRQLSTAQASLESGGFVFVLQIVTNHPVRRLLRTSSIWSPENDCCSSTRCCGWRSSSSCYAPCFLSLLHLVLPQVQTPSNFIFFIGLFFLLAISLSASSIASKQALNQEPRAEQALLAKKLEKDDQSSDSD